MSDTTLPIITLLIGLAALVYRRAIVLDYLAYQRRRSGRDTELWEVRLGQVGVTLFALMIIGISIAGLTGLIDVTF